MTSPAAAISRPRIGVFVERFPELSQTFVLDQLVALEREGFDLRVFAIGRSERAPRHRLLEVAAFAEHHPVARLLGRRLSPRRVRSFARDFAVRALDARAVQHCDLLLCHFGPNGLRAVSAAERAGLAVPIWTIFHGYDLSRYLEQHGGGVYEPLFKRGNRFLAVSRQWMAKLVALGCDPSRIHLLRMGVDCAAIPFVLPDSRQEGPLRVLSVGRLVEKKGTEFSLHALARAHQLHPECAWTFDIIGTGPLESHLRRLAQQLKLSERVRFLGAVPPQEVRKHLAAADVFLLPSVVASDGDMEGIPVALMEAMAAGVPVVSSIHSGIPELVEHDVSGMLAPERDVVSLADHLLCLFLDPEKRQRLAVAARAKVEAEFDQAAIHRDFIDSMRSFLEHRSPPAPDRGELRSSISTTC